MSAELLVRRKPDTDKASTFPEIVGDSKGRSRGPRPSVILRYDLAPGAIAGLKRTTSSNLKKTGIIPASCSLRPVYLRKTSQLCGAASIIEFDVDHLLDRCRGHDNTLLVQDIQRGSRLLGDDDPFAFFLV